MSKSLIGTWSIIQKWDGAPAYNYIAHFGNNGIVSVQTGNQSFIGTYMMDDDGKVSMSIADFGSSIPGQSVTTFLGKFTPWVMHGKCIGVRNGSQSSYSGIWTASLLSMLVADEKEFHLPD